MECAHCEARSRVKEIKAARKYRRKQRILKRKRDRGATRSPRDKISTSLWGRNHKEEGGRKCNENLRWAQGGKRKEDDG